MLEPQSLGFDAFWFDIGSIGGNVPDKLVFSSLKYKSVIYILIMQEAIFSEMLVFTYQITRHHKVVLNKYFSILHSLLVDTFDSRSLHCAAQNTFRRQYLLVKMNNTATFVTALPFIRCTNIPCLSIQHRGGDDFPRR